MCELLFPAETKRRGVEFHRTYSIRFIARNHHLLHRTLESFWNGPEHRRSSSAFYLGISSARWRFLNAEHRNEIKGGEHRSCTQHGLHTECIMRARTESQRVPCARSRLRHGNRIKQRIKFARARSVKKLAASGRYDNACNTYAVPGAGGERKVEADRALSTEHVSNGINNSWIGYKCRYVAFGNLCQGIHRIFECIDSSHFTNEAGGREGAIERNGCQVEAEYPWHRK